MAVLLRATKGSALTHTELDANFTSQSIGEPKGISGADANEVYIADGAGSGAWVAGAAYGGIRYDEIGTGTTITTPTSYTLINTAGTSEGLKEFTANSLGRLTYTGTPARHIHMVWDTTFKHSAGGGVDVFFQVYKNGAATGAIKPQEATNSGYSAISLHYNGPIVTNDYFEIFVKTGSGSVVIHSDYMFILGVPT